MERSYDRYIIGNLIALLIVAFAYGTYAAIFQVRKGSYQIRQLLLLTQFFAAIQLGWTLVPSQPIRLRRFRNFHVFRVHCTISRVRSSCIVRHFGNRSGWTSKFYQFYFYTFNVMIVVQSVR